MVVGIVVIEVVTVVVIVVVVIVVVVAVAVVVIVRLDDRLFRVYLRADFRCSRPVYPLSQRLWHPTPQGQC